MLKILQNLVRISIPESIFEMVASKLPSQTMVPTKLSLESGFCNRWLQKLVTIRQAAFDETLIRSQGSYEVSQEIASLLLAILGS